MAVKGKGKQIAGKSAATPSSSGKRKIPHVDSESSGARPKKKRSGILQFVDDAAKDADFEMEEEEEEDDDLEWEDFDDFDFELPDIGTKEVKNVMKGPGKSSPLPFFIKEEEMNDDELEEAIKERYRGSGFVSFDDDIKTGNNSELVAHATKDLSVWRVKCMMGRERQAAFCLMQKFVDLQKIGKKLLIFSVFALDHVKGFVYIEADKVCDVFEACNGLCILYPSRVEFVPRNEAPSLLSIQKKACAISKGTWVRMKNGKYKGDLAEVVLVNDAKKRVTIKLVPRIDLQAISKKFGGGTSLKASATPAPRLISSHELEDFRPHIEIRRDHETGEVFEVLDGLMLKDGYLYKKVSMVSLIHWGVQPSSTELVKFEDTGKDEVKDVSWLSSIYKVNPKKKLPETSNVTHGGKPNQKDGVKQRNGFDLDDLVLFGKKSCGIIVDMENDTFKILKGDLIGSEVVTINIREIKKKCIDKVFTATDRCMKTISIDDVVNVSEGPLEGRAGIVRHMYKGILFIYDECQSENNGFFCAKSGICDLVKKSRDFSAGKSGSKGGPSFAQSPIRSSEQEDDSQNPSRKSRRNNQGTFSVGQTLRICKGQLKGYLCRVIRIYRADITVKLDSLGKLLTVDEKLLSFPNSKRDDATALQSDMFGNQEDQSTGGLMNEGRGLGVDNCDLNAGISSFGRDSWSAPSSSSFSFPTDRDSKDQEQKAANSWGKAPSTIAENSWNKTGAEATNSWGKAPDTVAENSWNKTGAEKDAADAWNKPSSKAETSTDGWKNDNTSKKTDQNSSMEGASDGWARVVSAPVESQTLGEDVWSKTASKGPTVSNTETGGWGKTKVPSSDTGGSWNTKDSSEKGKSEDFGGQSGSLASPNSGGDNRGSWDIKGKGILGTNDDIWGKSAASQGKSTDGNQAAGWVSSAPSVEQVGAAEKAGWGKTIDGNQTTGWGSSATNVSSSFEAGSQSNSWDKAKTPSSSSGWGKSNETAIDTVADWKSTTAGDQATGWGASAVNSAKPTVELHSQTCSWDKVSIPLSSSGWQKSNQVDTTVKEGWKKDGFSSGGQIDGWNKEKTSDRDQSSGWNKAGNTEGGKDGTMDGWNKAKSSEGQGFGQESQREWKRGDASSKDSDWGQGSGWSQGNSNNENGKNWNQQRDFDGGRGSSRGRGRGRFEGRGGRNEDGDSGGGGRFGRGGGRGRNGGGGYNRDGSDTREFGRGRGRGRGREQGQGHFESSDWRTKQESSGDGGFSSKPSSSWGGAGGSSWAKNRDEHSTVATNENAGWNNKKSYGGATVPGWGTDSQDAGESKKDMNADHSSSWGKVASTGKQIDDWNKDDKNDNWINKTSDNKTSSWNQMSAATEGDSKWNTSIATSSQPSGWKKNEIKGINTTNASEVSLADRDTSSVKLNVNDWSQTSTNKEKEAADSQGGWKGPKVSTQVSIPSSENENNWGNSKGDGSGNPVSSKSWGGNNSENMDSGSTTAWEARKEPSSSQSAWGGVGKDSSGNKSSDWNNGGNKWNKQSEGQGNSESWGHGSDIGGGGGRGRFNSFSGGRSDFGRGGGRGGRDNSFSGGRSDFGRGGGRGGRDNSFSGRGGGRGRDNSFSGRGRGRNSEGRFGWNGGGDGSVQEDNGEKRSWKSEGGNQPAGWAKQGSGWASASAPVSKVNSGKSSWESQAEPGSNTITPGWESASAIEPVPSNVGTSGWASGNGSSIKPHNDPQDKIKLLGEENMGNDKSDKPGSWDGKTSVSSAAIDSTGQNAAWGGGQSKTGQVGGWERTDIPSEKSSGNNKLKGSGEDGNSSKSGSWDGLGPGSKITTDSAAGPNDAAGGPDDSRGRDENNPWGKAAGSWGDSGHRGGNAGW